MMRILLLLLSLPLLAAAVPPDSVDMQRLQSLGAKLPAAADEGDFLVALASTAAAPGHNDNGDWKAQDYDDLYALLQKYRDELKALGLQNDKYQKMLDDLNKRSDELKKRLDLLKPLDGMKIHGDVITYYDDLLVSGGGADTLESGHFRHAVQRAELDLTYTRGLLTGLVEYDFQYLFGNQFDSEVVQGVQQVPTQSGFSQGARQMYVDLATPLQIRVGYFDYKQTPLTFWRNEDPDPYIPEPFASRQERLREDLLLKDDNRNILTGLRLLSDPEFWGGNHLHFSAALSQLATQPASGDLLTPGVNMIYESAGPSPTQFLEVNDTYLAAWMLHYSTPENMLDFGIQGTYIGDQASDTNDNNDTYTVNPDPTKIGQPFDTFYGVVNSFSASLSPTSWMTLDGEVAMSSFHAPAVAMFYDTPSLGEYGTLNSNAGFANLRLDFGWLTLHGRFADVGSGFTSSPAQARTWDPNQSPMGPFETENSLFDPQSGGFSQLQAPRGPETMYNRTILPPAYWYISGSNLISSNAKMPYDPTTNGLDPYGLATPNRQRVGGGMDLKFFNGGGLVGVDYDMASEIDWDNGNAPESFTRLIAGTKIDLAPMLKWPLRLTGSYTLQSTDNSEWVAFDSVRLQGGVAYDLWSGGTMQFGYRHLDFNGVLPYVNPGPFAPVDGTLLGYGREIYNATYDQWAVGLVQALGDDLLLTMNYGNLAYANALAGQVTDPTEGRPSFLVTQGYARLTLRF